VALCEEWRDTGGKSGMCGLDVSNGQACAAYANGNKSARSAWRIPVSGFDAFVRRAAGVAAPQTK